MLTYTFAFRLGQNVKKYTNIIPLLLLTLLAGCKEEGERPDQATLELELLAIIDQAEIIPDTQVYTNKAGNLLSITRLEYYVSDFRFRHVDGRWVEIDNYVYHDALGGGKKIQIHNLPYGDYDSLSFSFGLNAAMNKIDALPGNLENISMAWPDHMGGGYHFLKLEGRFRSANGQSIGYSCHLGENISERPIKVAATLGYHGSGSSIRIVMDPMEWFGGNFVLDLNNHNYTMGIDSLMTSIAGNAPQVFKITVP